MSAKKGRSSFFLKFIVVLAILAAAVVYTLRALRPVARVEPVVSGEAIDAKPASVTVKVEKTMDLESEVGGRLIDDGFSLKIAKPVKKGDVLAKLDGGDLELDIEQVEHDLEAAKAKVAVGSSIALELEGALSDLATQERLFKLGQISKLDYQKAQRTVAQTRQKLELEKVTNKQEIQNLETQLKQKKRQLEKMTIVAPFDGIVTDIYANPGQEIGSNTPIATLIAQHKIVEAQISEEDFANIRKGEPAQVSFLTYGSYFFNGHVSEILPTADPLTQRHRVYIELTDISPEKLVPGITGDAAITIDTHHADAIVPRRALFNDSLYVVRNGVVTLVKVKPGAVWITGAEVLPREAGDPPPVAPGDLVIVEQLEQFHDGEHVGTIVQPSDAIPKSR